MSLNSIKLIESRAIGRSLLCSEANTHLWTWDRLSVSVEMSAVRGWSPSHLVQRTLLLSLIRIQMKRVVCICFPAVSAPDKCTRRETVCSRVLRLSCDMNRHNTREITLDLPALSLAHSAMRMHCIAIVHVFALP